MQTILAMYTWVIAHPWECVQWILFAWAIANVIWAQWPKPKSDKALAVWKAIHHVFQLISTSAGAKGTFTWPSLIRAVLGALLSGPDPFEDGGADAPSKPAAEAPPRDPAPTKPESNNKETN